MGQLLFNSRLKIRSRSFLPKNRGQWVVLIFVLVLLVSIGLFFASGAWRLFEKLDDLSDVRVAGLTPVRVVVQESELSRDAPSARQVVGFEGADPILGEGCRPSHYEGDDVLARSDEVNVTGERKERPLGSEKPCDSFIIWRVIRSPLAVDVVVIRGDDLATWLSSNQAFALLGKSPAFKGMFGGAKSGLEVILRDLQAPRFLRWFLGHFLRSAFAGDATFSYENIHNRSGFVFSFEANRSFLARKGLLLLARAAAVRQLSVKPLEHPVWELKFGKRTAFLAQAGKRFFVGRNLSAVFNAMEWGRLEDAKAIDGTIAVTIHPQAFFGRQLRALVGREDLPVYLGVKLLGNSTLPTVGFVEDVPLFRVLRPALLEDVLQPIPKDVIGAAAASFPPPRSLGRNAFARLMEKNGTIDFVRDNTQTGGIGVVWDVIDKKNEVGVILTGLNGRGGNGLPIKIFDFEMDYVASCLLGNAALFASSEELLERMKQACNGAVPSYFGLKLFGGEALTQYPVFAVLNPLKGERQSTLPPAGYVGRYTKGKGIELQGVMMSAEF